MRPFKGPAPSHPINGQSAYEEVLESIMHSYVSISINLALRFRGHRYMEKRRRCVMVRTYLRSAVRVLCPRDGPGPARRTGGTAVPKEGRKLRTSEEYFSVEAREETEGESRCGYLEIGSPSLEDPMDDRADR